MLNDLLPREELSARLGAPLILSEFGLQQVHKIAKAKPGGLHEIAANVWNRIIQKKWHKVDPMQFARYFNTGDPNLYRAISKLLNIEVIHDIYFAKGWKEPRKSSNLVVEFLVAHVYPNDLHLADITFMDPTRPIKKEDRTYPLQTHRGFGLLPILMTNMQARAIELGLSQITLTAANRGLVPLFEQYGFVVEDSSMGRASMENGLGIPMERDV